MSCRSLEAVSVSLEPQRIEKKQNGCQRQKFGRIFLKNETFMQK